MSTLIAVSLVLLGTTGLLLAMNAFVNRTLSREVERKARHETARRRGPVREGTESVDVLRVRLDRVRRGVYLGDIEPPDTPGARLSRLRKEVRRGDPDA